MGLKQKDVFPYRPSRLSVEAFLWRGPGWANLEPCDSLRLKDRHAVIDMCRDII